MTWQAREKSSPSSRRRTTSMSVFASTGWTEYASITATFTLLAGRVALAVPASYKAGEADMAEVMTAEAAAATGAGATAPCKRAIRNPGRSRNTFRARSFRCSTRFTPSFASFSMVLSV